MQTIFTYILDISAQLGYPGIILLMAIESSFIPFPSEIIIPPAAYLAARGEMNIFLIIIAGVTGSILGALANYYLALTIGRKAVYSFLETKWAKWLLLDVHKMRQAEEYFNRYGRSATFVCRLVPAVRQLISIPAGFARMNILSFITYTALGSTLWVTILALLGYFFGANHEKLHEYYNEISIAGVLLAVLFMTYIFVKSRSRHNNRKDAA